MTQYLVLTTHRDREGCFHTGWDIRQTMESARQLVAAEQADSEASSYKLYSYSIIKAEVEEEG